MRRQKRFEFSSETQKTFRECIEYSQGGTKEVLTEIPLIYQILLARSEDDPSGQNRAGVTFFDVSSNSREKYMRFSEIADWTTLGAIIELLFPFARGMQEEVRRPDLASRINFKMDMVADDLGYSLANDAAYQQQLTTHRKGGPYQFSEANWRDRWRAV